MGTTKQEKSVNIKISKFAYIFNDFCNFYPSTKAEKFKKFAIIPELKKFYYESELRQKEICATLKKIKLFSGEEIERYYININGYEVALNALEIDWTSEENSIINHRKVVDFGEINADGFALFLNEKVQEAHSKKFASLYFENFTSKNSLQCIKVHFKRNYTTFIIDSRNGDLYTGKGVEHKKTDINEIINAIDATSEDAKKAIADFIIQLQNQ